MRQKILKAKALFPLPSAAHLLPRFSLRSQHPELSVDALMQLYSRIYGFNIGYDFYTPIVCVCQELFCAGGGQVNIPEPLL